MVAVANAIRMADLRGAGGAARPVVARVISIVGEGAAVELRPGEYVMLNRWQVAFSPDDLSVFGARGFLEKIIAGLRLNERVPVKLGKVP